MGGTSAQKTPDWIWDQAPDARYGYESRRGGAKTQTAKQRTSQRNRSFKRGK